MRKNKTLYPSKKFLTESLQSINRRIKNLKKDITFLSEQIKEEKSKKLSNTSESHERLWRLRMELEFGRKMLKMFKNEYRKIEKEINENYNEHNINNISEHGISKKFLSCKNPKDIIQKFNWDLSPNLTWNENVHLFLCNCIKKNDKWKDLLEEINNNQ